MTELSDLTVTGALLTLCIAAFYFGGRIWERRYGPSNVFTFALGPWLIAGVGSVTVVLLIVTAIVGF